MSADGQPVAGTSLRQWENAEFPILCDGCLGENPYVRMLIDRYGMACKMCDRPFTIFKWRPGRGEGYKKTEVCQTCAKVKNLCQTCLLDLQMGLPSQLRDAVLATADDGLALPESDCNREYQAQQQLMLLNSGLGESLGQMQNEKLLQIARSVSQNRDQPRIKMFQKKPVPEGPGQGQGQKRSAEEAQLDDEEEDDQAQLVVPLLPAGMTMERLPANIKNFVMKHFAASQGQAAAEHVEQAPAVPVAVAVAEVKQKKGKFLPRPPAGPPPASALVK